MYVQVYSHVQSEKRTSEKGFGIIPEEAGMEGQLLIKKE